MQRRARSGELAVFGATRYFAVREERSDRGSTHELVEARTKSFRKKNLLPASTSRRHTHDEPPINASSSSSTTSRGSISDVVPKADDACGGVGVHDLGVVVGDRRLRGVRVVNGDVEERWVVRCGAWEEEERRLFLHDCKIFDDDAASSSSYCHQVGGGHGRGSDTDSSSDLFELDFWKILKEDRISQEG